VAEHFCWTSAAQKHTTATGKLTCLEPKVYLLQRGKYSEEEKEEQITWIAEALLHAPCDRLSTRKRRVPSAGWHGLHRHSSIERTKLFSNCQELASRELGSLMHIADSPSMRRVKS
jgi:hypothetical protein